MFERERQDRPGGLVRRQSSVRAGSGRPAIGSMGLGQVSVSGRNREPTPAARMTAFM
jgi:hypothetical protein